MRFYEDFHSESFTAKQELLTSFSEENMGYGSIINKLNSFMDNIEDPEGTEQNLNDFNLQFNAIPDEQLQGSCLGGIAFN